MFLPTQIDKQEILFFSCFHTSIKKSSLSEEAPRILIFNQEREKLKKIFLRALSKHESQLWPLLKRESQNNKFVDKQKRAWMGVN